MKISREVKTGVLVLLGIILFVLGFNYLKGQNLFATDEVYYTEFNYNALSKSSPVTVRGNAVGKVQDIFYDFETGKTRIAFTVDEKLKFSKNSKIRLYETGLMGGNAIAIIIKNDGEQAKPGDVLKSEVEEGLIRSLSKNFSGLSVDLNTTLKSTDTLLTNLNKIVSDDSDAGLKQTISELNTALTAYKNLAYSIDNVVKENDTNIAYILDDANVKLICIQEKRLWRRLKEAFNENNNDIKSLQRILLFESSKFEESIDEEYQDSRLKLIKEWLPEKGDLLPKRKADTHDLATIVYTSGTGYKLNPRLLQSLSVT